MTTITLKIGGHYNWRNQPERLIYLGRNFSGNGFWHQFAKIESPTVVWSEVLDSDIYHFEESKNMGFKAMTRTELLELAAKAIGMNYHKWGIKGEENFADMSNPNRANRWNPLDDDADAFRLAAKLYLDVNYVIDEVYVSRSHPHPKVEVVLTLGDDELKDVRMAIVQAAAEIQLLKESTK